MRPIKFRGKRLDNGKLIYGDMVRQARQPQIIYIESPDGISARIDPNTIGQYIGFNDIDNHDIYERDILQSSDGTQRGPILWDEQLARFVWYDAMNRQRLPVSQLVCRKACITGDISSDSSD